jgi:pimeloyl-ACP methyl ester carboxylesterase
MSPQISQWQIVIAILAGLALLLVAGALVLSWWRRRRLQPHELETEKAIVGPWTWRYHTSGKGPDLILLHGLGANLYCWQHLIPILKSRYRVWALDLPGFGGSSKLPREHYGLDEQVQRLLQFMDRHEINQTYIVGNSMGGNIALWLALKHPDRVKGVGVIAPATSPRLMPLNLSRWAWLATPASMVMTRTAIGWAHRRTVSKRERVDLARIEETYKTYGRQPAAIRSFLRATEAIRDPRLPDALKDLGTKVLLLWGSADLLVSKKVMDDLKASLAAPESHFHDGGGHHLQEDDPDWVGRKIVEFFERNLD